MTEIFVEPEPGTSPDSTIRVPKGPLYGAAAVIALVFTLAITARTTGLGASREPVSPPVEQRDIRFLSDSGGGLQVYDAATGEMAAYLPAGSNGFIFGMLRGMQQRRAVAGTDPATPYHLARGADGHITLDDPATGMHVAVNSFGPTQIASVGQLFASSQVR